MNVLHQFTRRDPVTVAHPSATLYVSAHPGAREFTRAWPVTSALVPELAAAVEGTMTGEVLTAVRYSPTKQCFEPVPARQVSR